MNSQRLVAVAWPGTIRRLAKAVLMALGLAVEGVLPAGESLVLAACGPPALQEVAEPTQEAEPRTEIWAEGWLEYRSEDNGYYLARIELPSLEGGKKYKLRLHIKNPTDQEISFSRIILDCACSKFETPVDVILPHDSAVFTMLLDTPIFGRKGSRAVAGAQFLNVETRQVAMRLSVTYELNNVFSLPGHRLAIEVPRTTEERVERIPVSLTPPLTLQDLEVEVSDSLRDLSVQLVEFEERPYVEVLVIRKAIPRAGLFGELQLKRRGFQQPYTLTVELKHQELIAVTPDSLRFTLVSGKQDRWEANAVIRCTEAVKEGEGSEGEQAQDEAESRKAPQPTPEVAVTVDGTAARVVLKPLGQRGVYRVSVFLDQAYETESCELKWGIRFGQEERQIESRAFFFR